MDTSTYPVRVDAALEPQLNRWLWLVKWLLLIPHYLVLAFLWLAFALLSVMAFFAILVTGRYPQGIFDFNVGVLRWSWRVAYYGYGVLGTDRYPPFTLNDVPGYPAHLSVEYPERLSRGLALVKWWLLALPHYLVVAFFVGGGWYVANEATSDPRPILWSGGLIGLLVLIAAVILLFSGSYPQPIFDLVLGLNRWVLRVTAYAALMTDHYPPFRLDMGASDAEPPGTAEATGAPAADPYARATSTPYGQSPPAVARSWTAGRATAVVLGSLLFVLGGGLLAGGGTLAVADNTLRDGQGYIMTRENGFSTASYALVSEPLELHADPPAEALPSTVLGEAKLEVTSGSDRPIFVGVADAADADAYLSGVRRSTVTDFRGGAWNRGIPVYLHRPGTAPSTPPTGTDIWVASASGGGPQAVTWPLAPGDWTIVVMNADGSAEVAADVAIGASLPVIGWLIGGLLLAGGVVMLLSLALIIVGLRTRTHTNQFNESYSH